MRSLLTICVLFLTSLTVGQQAATAQQSMTHEEQTVRTAYAKFAYAAEQNEMTKLATESLGHVVGLSVKTDHRTSDERLAAARVSFILTDFVTGNVADIIDRKAVDFISQ